MIREIKKITIMFMAIIVVMATIFPSYAGTIKRPDISASGAIVYCENTGEIVYSKNKNKTLDPLSVTKIMTVLIAVQNIPLDREITVSKEAASQGESTMGLVAGEVLTVKDLIYGAIIKSGNDAAYALGEGVSGNMKDFVKLMNKTADNIGCKNTKFSNPHGLLDDNNYTTADDMFQIYKIALSNSTIKAATGATFYQVPKTNKSKARKLKRSMALLKDDSTGVYSAKTGYWDDYNSSIALAYKKDGLSLYIVILGDTIGNRTSDVNKLIDYTTKKVEGVKTISSGKAVGKVRIKHGEKTVVEAITSEDGYAYLPKEASKSLIGTKVVMKDDIKAPVKADTVVGTYQIYVADELVNEVDLTIRDDVGVGWFPSYLGISNFASMIIGIILLIFLILLLALALVRLSFKLKRKKRRQEKIRAIAIEQLRIEEEQRERDWHF